MPKNIYGITKVAAENLRGLFHNMYGLLCIILRTSRFFPEPDDSKEIRQSYQDANAKVNEFLYRRADIEDVVNAHLLALDRAQYQPAGSPPMTSHRRRSVAPPPIR